MFTFIADAMLAALCVVWTLGLAGVCGLLLLWHTDEDVGMRRHLLSTGILLCATIVLTVFDRMLTATFEGAMSWLATFLESALLVVGAFAVLEIVVLCTAVYRWLIRRNRPAEDGQVNSAEAGRKEQ